MSARGDVFIDIEDSVDNDTSNIDPPSDIGSSSNFTAQKYGPDGEFDTLTEADTSSSEWLDCDAFDSTWTGWATVGSTPYLDAQDQPVNLLDEVIGGGEQIGWFDFPATSLSGSLTVNITIYCNNDDGAGDDSADVYVDYTGSGGGSYVGTVGQHTNWQYDSISLGTHTISEVNNLRVYFIGVKSSGPDNVRIDHVRIGVSKAPNYEIDLEIQWTSVDFNQDNEYLCIYGGTMGGEPRRICLA